MHIIEKEMINLYYQEKNWLSGKSHIIINDISSKITAILNDFNFLRQIPKSYFKTHFNLNVPILDIAAIYTNHNEIKNITQINKWEINYNNISEIINTLKPKLEQILNDYNNFFYNIGDWTYESSKICFHKDQILIVRENEIIDQLHFWQIDPEQWFYIQNKLHYIGRGREDTLIHLWFTNSKWIILWYCSFSILDREYPLPVFRHWTTKDQIINMTRAFTINNSPSNLMWWLFHKSYQYIKQHYNQIEYIMTYINQNLWFEWSSFKWASYVPVWLSPLQYLYINWNYTNRKWIWNLDNISKNKLQILPIVLLARWLDGKKQKEIEERKDIYNISQKDYFSG